MSFGIQRLTVIQQHILLGLGLTTDTHFGLEPDPQHLFLLQVLIICCQHAREH